MKTLAQSFLTKHEQEKISSCVHQQEKETSGEIVPLIASASHSYPLAPVVGGVLCALPFSLALTRLVGSYLWIGQDNMWLFLVLFSILFTMAYQCIKRSLHLKRLFLLSDRSDKRGKRIGNYCIFHRKALPDQSIQWHSALHFRSRTPGMDSRRLRDQRKDRSRNMAGNRQQGHRRNQRKQGMRIHMRSRN